MVHRSKCFGLLAGAALLVLAGCGEDQATEANPSSPASPPASRQDDETKPPAETAKEGLDKLREAAEQAVRDAEPALDRARETAGKVLEEIRPTIEQLGTSISEITKRAQEDFAAGVESLEKRLDEYRSSDGPIVTGNPAATLPPSDRLRTDTRAAARASDAGVGPGHVGVWVSTASECTRVDQEPLEVLAVITPTTVRRYESVCNMPETELKDGTASVDAQCVVEGEVETRKLTFTSRSPDRLTLATADGTRVDLVRCHLPR